MNANPHHPVVVGDVHQVLAALQPHVARGARLIAVDGVTSAGKSTLRAQLCEALPEFTPIELDDYLVKDTGKYVDALRFDELSVRLESAPRKVVSGVCVLLALRRFGLTPDVHIYVKRMAKWGWADRDEVEGEEIEELAQAVGVSAADFSLHLEVRAYHRGVAPQRVADIVLERLEAN
ncbi:MAG: hypothetical protein ACK54X_22790 [Burkholderiales bacterium]|jgi:hypothetical protein